MSKQQTKQQFAPVVNNTVVQQPASVSPWPTTPTVNYKQPECHKGNVLVFTYEHSGVKVEFYGGGTSRGSMHTPEFILIALQSTDYGDVAPVSFKGLSMPGLDKYKSVRIINIAIPDGDAPGLPLEFWQDLLAELVLLADQEKNKKLKVLVRCAGGHGRTGVVLCALAVAANVCPGQDSIAWIRQRYCTKAVETGVQFDYVEWLSGVPSKEDVKPPFQVTYQAPATGVVQTTCTQPQLVGMETAGKVPTTTGCTTSPAMTPDEYDDDGNSLQTRLKNMDAQQRNFLLEEERRLLSVTWLDDPGCWEYEERDRTKYRSSDDPTVFGVELIDGMYNGFYVERVEYLPDVGMVELFFQGDAFVQLAWRDDNGKPEIYEVDEFYDVCLSVQTKQEEAY